MHFKTVMEPWSQAIKFDLLVLLHKAIFIYSLLYFLAIKNQCVPPIKET